MKDLPKGPFTIFAHPETLSAFRKELATVDAPLLAPFIMTRSSEHIERGSLFIMPEYKPDLFSIRDMPEPESERIDYTIRCWSKPAPFVPYIWFPEVVMPRRRLSKATRKRVAVYKSLRRVRELRRLPFGSSAEVMHG